jgi:uncharacterized protein (DUF924 family)
LKDKDETTKGTAMRHYLVTTMDDNLWREDARVYHSEAEARTAQKRADDHGCDCPSHEGWESSFVVLDFACPAWEEVAIHVHTEVGVEIDWTRPTLRILGFNFATCDGWSG